MHIHLAVIRHRLWQVGTQALESLTLGPVDGHGKACLDRELAAHKAHWHCFVLIRYATDAQDEEPLALGSPTDHLSIYDPLVQLLAKEEWRSSSLLLDTDY